MEIAVSAEAKDKRLNKRVAITVVVLSVFMGLARIKDGNIVQNMTQTQAASVGRWNEYQATRTKQHLVENGARQIAALATDPARARRDYASDAALSTAISLAAVAALAENGWLLAAAWVFGGFGLFMGLCGFVGWSFHPAVLSGLLG